MAKAIPRQAILIVNAKSRQGADAFEQARELLTAAGIELIDAKAVKDPKKMGTAVRQAIKKAPMVIVGGGDGSLSSNIAHFLNGDTIFALLPLGTANSFARTMEIPLELEGAIDVIVNGEPRCIDVGKIEDQHFLNAAAIGLAPEVAKTVPHDLKRRLGRFGYLMWAGWSATNFNAFRLQVDDGRRVRRLWATEVRIANGRFHGGVELIESADVESGRIVVQAVRGRSLARLGWSYFASAFKLKSRAEPLREFRAPKMTLKTRPPMQVSIDGELGPETPFTVEAIANAVTIAAPRTESAPAKAGAEAPPTIR
jgi:YegS/Rv2252/BmrU family lipid kinase